MVVITHGGEHGYNIYNCTGTEQSRHRQRPLSGLCLVTSSVSYQGVILVLHSRLTLSCRHRVLSTVVLKVRFGRPNGARERYIDENDREGTTDVTGVLGPCSYLARVTTPRKSSSTKSDARQGKETVHLVGNHRELVGRQGGHRRY